MTRCTHGCDDDRRYREIITYQRAGIATWADMVELRNIERRREKRRHAERMREALAAELGRGK